MHLISRLDLLRAQQSRLTKDVSGQTCQCPLFTVRPDSRRGMMIYFRVFRRSFPAVFKDMTEEGSEGGFLPSEVVLPTFSAPPLAFVFLPALVPPDAY